MKKTKIIIPALGLLVLSTAASVSGTVAWFSMNNTVSATAMQLKVKADDGILISNSAKSEWSDSADATVTSATLLPTSAAAVATPTFVTANSTNADQAQAGQAVANYSSLSLTWTGAASSEGIGFVDEGQTPNGSLDTTEKAYVLLNKFYIKSSGATISATNNETLLYINDVSVAPGNATNQVDNALRVLVVVNTDAFVYAPVIDVASATTTLSYRWKNTTDVTAKPATAYDQACASVTSISNLDASATAISIYCYYEGEDANCKSTNISGITMNDLNVTVNFGTVVKHA